MGIVAILIIHFDKYLTGAAAFWILGENGRPANILLEKPMDKPIDEWKRRFRGMEPEALQNAWSVKAKQDVSWTEECNFHAAVAHRFKQIGNMAIDLDEDTRLMLCQQANVILKRLQSHLRNEPEKLATVRKSIAESDKYFTKFGTKTARYYMYEQGVIDVLGDRMIGSWR
jgi:hypothetical protein